MSTNDGREPHASSSPSVPAIGEVRLREVLPSDLPIFFEHQRDPIARQMAAFGARERPAFDLHWAKILVDSSAINRTVLVGESVAGHVVSFDMFGERLVGYWIGREHWGRGVASSALRALLKIEPIRPLHARCAADNIGSIRVLEKCGFLACGETQIFCEARDAEIRELIFVLAAAR